MSSKGQKLLTAGAAVATTEIVMAVAHGGAIGAIVGIGIGIATYMYADDLAAGRDLPSLPALKPKKPGQHSIAYRLLNGKSTRGEQMGTDEPFEEGGPSNTPDHDPLWRDEGDEIEDDCLELAPDLRPHVDTVFSRRVTVLGRPGAGKTNTVSDLVEELGRFDAALIVFDSKPEYAPLCEQPFLSNPYRANAGNVTPQGAFDFGIQMMNERLQVVLDLPSYKNDTTAAKVMVQILAAIYAWEEALPNGQRFPVTIVLDEAHEWLPQNPKMSTVSKAEGKDGQPSIFTQLQQAFFSLLKGGRSFGMGCIISTQRPADIDNRAIAFGDWRFFLNADLPGDLKVYQGFDAEAGKVAPTLAPGQAYVKGPGVKGVYQLRQKLAPDESKSPGVEALQKQTPVYKNPGQVNTETPVNDPVYSAVNGTTGGLSPSSGNGRLRLLETAVNANVEQETPSSPSVNVNGDIRKMIRRMVDHGMKHRDVAKIVGLDGRHYNTYKIVCLEEGIKIEKEA
jgi:uncharacterized protein DUF87